jgi:hypothetical protein
VSREVEDLPKGVFGDANPSGLGDASQARGDIDAVAHEVAVAFLDQVAEVDAAGTQFGAPFARRCRTVLHFDGAAHRVDHADQAIIDVLDDAAVVCGDGGIDQVPRRPRRHTSVRSSSAPARRVYPTTSATRIVTSLRVSLINFCQSSVA